MKKRVLCSVLCAGLLLSLAGCGDGDQKGKTSEMGSFSFWNDLAKDTESDHTEALTEKKTTEEMITEAETAGGETDPSEATTEAEMLWWKTYNDYYLCRFNEGYTWVTYKNWEGKYSYCVIDSEQKAKFKIDGLRKVTPFTDGSSLYIYTDSDGYHLGIIDTQGNELYSVSSKEDEYDCLGCYQGLYLIWENVRNMTEDAGYLYVIDKNGQEVIPQWKVSGEDGADRSTFTVQTIGDGLICYQKNNRPSGYSCIVDLKNKKYYENGLYFESEGVGTALMQSGSALAEDFSVAGFDNIPDVCASASGGYEYPIYQITYDDLTDATAWENRAQNRFDLSKLGYNELRSLGQDMVLAQKDRKAAVYNAVTGEKLFDLDFGENTTVNTCRGSGDYIYAEIKGADGRSYYCVMNRKGEKLYEPIRIEGGNCYFDQGYVLNVFIGNDKAKSSMTSRDGKVVLLKDGIDFIGKDEILFRDGDINIAGYTDKALVSDGYIWLEYFGYRNLSTGKSITKVGVEE